MSYRIKFAAICLSLIASTFSLHGQEFTNAAPGQLPDGWTIAKTGSGAGSAWEVQIDPTAPDSDRVLVQTSRSPAGLFNLCLAPHPRLRDLELSVSVRTLSGKSDQGGGVVWRYQDESNHYVARVNPLEQNFRVYKVIDGKRIQLATADVEAGTSTS